MTLSSHVGSGLDSQVAQSTSRVDHLTAPTPASASVFTDRGVWVDEHNALVRRGMIASLLADGIPVAGESAGLRPPPELSATQVMIFEADVGFPAGWNNLDVGNLGLVATLRKPTGATLYELADRGVGGILLVDELTPRSLIETVWAVANGRTTLSQSLMRRLMDHVTDVSLAAAGALNPRERQVLQMLAEGEETRSIALGLNYSERTVKNVVHDVLTKLNCRTRAQAVGMAMRAGIL
ncbi:hypothetical protein acdb102_22720 [Acidothermaceae bacterium B102]|nr:hypothetical protein acdb102_22720 [Acidothermaceae bacterium B102]